MENLLRFKVFEESQVCKNFLTVTVGRHCGKRTFALFSYFIKIYFIRISRL